jgi:hypothetical protein
MGRKPGAAKPNNPGFADNSQDLFSGKVLKTVTQFDAFV